MTNKTFKFSKRSLSRLEGVNPLLIAILVDSISVSTVDFGIPRHGGFRTSSEQFALYKKRPNVTNADGYRKKSKHQKGIAVDIYAYVNNRASWNIEHLTTISETIKKVAKEKYNINIKWGGDWIHFKDYPHFQI